MLLIGLLVMDLNDLIRPLGLDVRQNRYDVVVGQSPLISEHPGFVVVPSQSLDTVLSHLEEQVVRVVPGVAGLVVRWSQEITVLISLVPVSLAFQVPAMAAGAMLLINVLTKVYHRLILIEKLYLLAFGLMMSECPST